MRRSRLAEVRIVSAVTRVELSFVIGGRKGLAARERLERFFPLTGTEIVAVTPEHAEIAIEAFRRFGSGRYLAALNIGDCFSYALAVATDDSLLFKGDDFVRTDIRPALPPELAMPWRLAVDPRQPSVCGFSALCTLTTSRG